LKLPERRLLARLAGRRRHVSLDVKGALFAPRTGTYLLLASCDDACELWLDGRLLLAGEGSLSRAVELARGPRALELRYRQAAGPARLVVDWRTPSMLDLLPLEAYVAAEAEDFDAAGQRFRPATAWTLLLLGLAWLATASTLAVRAAESARGWGRLAARWWRAPPSGAPVALVRPLPWLAAAMGLGIAGLAARAALPARLEALRLEYAVNPQRAPFVLGRVETFPDYLLFTAALSALVALALHLLRPPSRAVPRIRWRRWLLAAIGVALVGGAWVSEDEWVRYGRPCYDGYCDYAERVRDVMLDPGPDSRAALRDHLARNYHANSPVGPVLIAATSLLGPGTVASYRLLSALATVGTLLLLTLLARRELDLGPVATLLAGLLFVVTGAVQRSFLFPQTDALAMFFFSLAVERLLSLRRRFTPWRSASAAVTVALALLTKLSALPLVAIGALLLVWPRGDDRPSFASLSRGALRSAAVLLPPLAVVLAYVAALSTSANVRTELHRIETLDSRFSFHLVAALVTLLPFFLAAALTLKRTWTRTELALTAAVAVYLLGLWTSGASGWERFYLNALPLALPVAIARLAPLEELRSPPRVALLTGAYAVAQAVRMLLHLYNGA
jgi:hypothetical protein